MIAALRRFIARMVGLLVLVLTLGVVRVDMTGRLGGNPVDDDNRESRTPLGLD